MVENQTKAFQFLARLSHRNTIIVSNSLDPDQAQHLFGPDLDPDCLQRLSVDDRRRQRVKVSMVFAKVNCYKHARRKLTYTLIPVTLLSPGTIRSDWLYCMDF